MAGYRLLDARGRAGVLALIGGMQPDNGNAIVRVKGNVGQYVEGNVTAPFTIDMSKKKQP
ncbi:Phage repressor [Cupriavidus basilensis]|uniref:Phage repressor n=1 Tax=Cupriavidus basilensis TaxID=68895 RepID=A0A0C4Y7Z0_9BURK|nr:Phage repressor [Cupriavidus basilensis]